MYNLNKYAKIINFQKYKFQQIAHVFISIKRFLRSDRYFFDIINYTLFIQTKISSSRIDQYLIEKDILFNLYNYLLEIIVSYLSIC